MATNFSPSLGSYFKQIPKYQPVERYRAITALLFSMWRKLFTFAESGGARKKYPGGTLLMKSQTSLKMGHVGLKTSSLGQILKKHCVLALEATFSVRLS